MNKTKYKNCGIVVLCIGLLIIIGYMTFHLIISIGLLATFVIYCLGTGIIGLFFATNASNVHYRRFGGWCVGASLVVPSIVILVNLLIVENYDVFVLLFGIFLTIVGLVVGSLCGALEEENR